MPRSISAAEKLEIVNMLLEIDESGRYTYGQRELEEITNLSRPYIRKIAAEIGRSFDRMGIEIRGKVCTCANCGFIFRRSPSKIKRAKYSFCDETCKKAYFAGPTHPNWKEGKTSRSFSTWVMNQSEYRVWKERVLANAGHKCEISGRTDNLHCHHILEKNEMTRPDKVFDVSNGMVLNSEIHTEMHKLMREGKDYDECVKILKDKYQAVAA